MPLIADRTEEVNDALVERFCENLRVFGSIGGAIQATGIGRETYFSWARRVNKGVGTALQRRFIDAVRIAHGEVKLFSKNPLTKHFKKNWRAIAWWLERKYPGEYERRRVLPLAATEDFFGARQK